MRRALGAGVSAIALSATAWVACGSEPEPTPGTGGADAGGGTAGTGGPSWGGVGAAPGGGAGGASGGTAGDGGIDWGAEPKWESTGQVAAGCPIERLANASEVKALVWESCSWSTACEQAAFNPGLFGAGAKFNPTSSVHDDGTDVRIALAVIAPNPRLVVTDGSGQSVAGFRFPLSMTDCWFRGASVWGNRIAALAGPVGGDHGGILKEFGSEAVSAFTLSNPPFGTPQRCPLGSNRWLWWWVPVSRFSTVSAIDGSDFVMFAKEGAGETALLSAPTAAGSIFLFDEFVLQDGGAAQRRVSWSDGKLPPAAYLTPPAPSDDYGFAAYANSHVGFMRGINRKGVNQYDAVEVWASPFSTDPAQLKPALVAKLSFTSTPELAGGHGVLATLTSIGADGTHGFTAWNITTQATRTFALPPERVYKALLGISRDHVYIAAAKPNTGPSAYLVRYPVP